MVYSASSARTLLEGTGDGSTYLVKYLMYGAFGLVLMQVMARRGLELAQRFGPIMLVVSFGLLVAVKIPGIGVEVNGARRWIGAGPLQFQPSEIMKLSLVLYAASLLAGKPKRLQTLKGVISPLLLVAGAAALLIASQPDLGTALVIGFTMSAMLVAAGMPMRHLATLGAGVAGLIFLFALLEPYRRARLTSFLDPWAHASDAGFQAVQGQIALGSGGLFGLGPGQSVQKIFYLPEAHTDFILAVIGEELGVVGVTVLMFLYGMIAYGGLRAAKAREDRLRPARRGRRHVAHPVAGAAEHLHGPRAGAADRRAAAVRLGGLDEHHGAAGVHGPAAEHRERAAHASARRAVRITG